MPDPAGSVVAAYGFAFLSVAVAFGIRLICWPILGAEAPFLFFVAAVVWAAWYGGFGPGVAVTLTSALPVPYFFLGRHGDGRNLNPGHLLQLTVFIVISVLISWLVESLHAARRRSEEAEREPEGRVRDRTAELARINEE